MPSTSPCALWKILLLFAVGIAFVALGILSFPFLDKYVKEKVSLEVPIKEPNNGRNESNLAYKFWKDVPQPMFMSFRFFHVENPLEITTHGDKPLLTERGPYVYSEKRHKTDIVFAENGTVVSFREESVYHFIPEMSVRGEDDTVRLLNVPFLTVLNRAKDESYLERLVLKGFISSTNTKLFETKTIRDWIWGYDDPLLKLLKPLKPNMVPFTFFGWFMHRNNSDTGGLTIKTGVDDLTNEAQIMSWKNLTELEVWSDAYCNTLNGTDGTMFHSFVEKEDTLYMFSPDICRSIYAKFVEETSIKGLRAFKFVIPSEVFGDTSVNPDNACFCIPDDAHCLGAGVLNISVCQFGAPVISSQPHLLQADPKYLSSVRGLSPSKSRHQTYVHIEPVTGMVLDAAKRLQINGFVENIPTWSTYFNKFPDKLVFPVIWIEESAVLDDATASTMRGQVTDQLHLVLAIQVTLLVFGAFLISSALLLVIHKLRHHCLTHNDQKTSAPSKVDVLAYVNPLDSQNDKDDHHQHQSSTSYGATAHTIARANDETRAPVAGENNSINSKPELPDWLAKIS